MSTALTVQRGATGVSVAPAAPLDFATMMEMGQVLVSTGFLPKAIQRPAQAVAIILAGQELGMAPMRALRSLVLVEGKVVEDAGSQLARFKTAGGKAVFAELTAQRAELHLRHPNGDEHVEVFTLQDAQRAGLANKDVWKKYPAAMLRSRCITAGLKSLGWEGAVGAYDPDEADAFRGVARPSTAPRAVDGSDYPEAGDDDEAPAAPLTLDEALALPLPGKPDAWGGHGGQPLGDLSPRLLAGVRKWLHDKLEDLDDDARLDLRRILEGIALVLPVVAQREAETKATVAPPLPDPVTATGADYAEAVGKAQDAKRGATADAGGNDDLF